MRNNWPFLVAASLLNSLLVTGAFIEFKLRGVSAIEPHYSGTNVVQSYSINNLLLAAGMFVLTFLLITAIIAISKLVTGVTAKLHAFNKSLANAQAAPNPLEALH